MNDAQKLQACIAAAKYGGDAIGYRPKMKKKARTKGDTFVGSHAIVTQEDYCSQEASLQALFQYDPDAYFVTEEHVKDKQFRKRLITPKFLDSLASRRVYVIDELDGSSSKDIEHYEWCVSVGCVENMVSVAGAVYAPYVYGGTLFSAQRGEGAFLITPRGKERLRVPPCALKDAYIIAGPDCSISEKYPVHHRFLGVLGNRSRTMNGNGSCALPLGLVAAGRANILIEPLQSPWDWAAGKLLVEEAGGVVQFYTMQQGKYGTISFLDVLEPQHYDPSQRAVGFIAGHRTLVNKIRKVLFTLDALGP